MANTLLVPTFLFLVVNAFPCSATVYTVGDTAGWDISTDLDSWSQNKLFNVGDTLLFQYSQYHSVCEVTQENYEGCNMTNVLQSSRNGNTSFALSSPGDRFFVCGNRLHCLGGMKLHAHVVAMSQGSSPVGSPQSQPGGSGIPPGTSQRSSPVSSASSLACITLYSLVIASFGLFLM